MIKRRAGTKSIGFGAKISLDKEKEDGDLLSEVQPEDLLKFGLIPELVGRLPVIAPMRDLAEEDLIRILKEPKNALTKQYIKLFELEGISLRFTDEALSAAARKAMERKSGARGLRSVMESSMLDVMYELPSDEYAVECVISEEVISKGEYPSVIRNEEPRKSS